MSASREKNKRKEQQAAPAAANEQKKGLSKGLKTTLIVVCAILVVCVIVFFYMLTSGFFASHATAATVSGHNLTPAEVNYFYRGSYNAMQNEYGDLMSYVLDTETPLDEQFYDEESGKTWADYFLEQGLTSAAAEYALYDEALANGYVLTEDDQATIDSQLSTYELYASYYGYDLDTYLAALYGTGCNEKNFREYMKVVVIADSYSAQISNGFTYSADEIAAEYAANPNTYDTVTFRQFLVSDSLFETDSTDETDETAETEELSEEELTALKQDMASTMAAAVQGDETAFINLSYENCLASAKESYADESYTRKDDQFYSSLSSDVADWLFDTARTEGDATYIATDSGVYYVLYFISRSTSDNQLPNVRHILVSVSDTSDEDAMAEARTKANEILDEFNAGEQTAERFGELAQQYTADSNGDEGGLYENIQPGQMVTAFNDWCFDESRQIGDTGIVETDYGVHVMYFDGYGKVYRDVMAENTLRTNDYNNWYNGVTGADTDSVKYTLNSFGMRYTTK